MPRIRPVRPEETSAEVRAAMERDMERQDHVGQGLGVQGHTPTIWAGARALDAGITAAGGISQQLRRLMNLRAAQLVGCPF